MSKTIDDAAGALAAVIVDGTPDLPFLGTGTAIVITALLAGTQLFRNTGLDQAELAPGSYVIVDDLNDKGIAVLGDLDQELAQLSVGAAAESTLPPLEGTGPTVPLTTLVERYEPVFLRLANEYEISSDDRPAMAIRAAGRILHRSSPAVSLEDGKGIFLQALVYACKHMPPRIRESG